MEIPNFARISQNSGRDLDTWHLFAGHTGRNASEAAHRECLKKKGLPDRCDREAPLYLQVTPDAGFSLRAGSTIQVAASAVLGGCGIAVSIAAECRDQTIVGTGGGVLAYARITDTIAAYSACQTVRWAGDSFFSQGGVAY